MSMLIRLSDLDASVDFAEAVALKSGIWIHEPDTLGGVLTIDRIGDLG